MPESIPLIATQAFDFEGRSYAVGESFSMRPIAAAAHVYQGKAQYASAAEYRTRHLEPQAPGATARHTRRYGRRDLTAKR